MFKNQLAEMQTITGAQTVKEAQVWVGELVMREYKGPGQMKRAIENVSRKIGVSYGVIWSLRYKPPAGLGASVYLRLKAAYEEELQRQKRLYEHERNVGHVIGKNVGSQKDFIVKAADFVAGHKEE